MGKAILGLWLSGVFLLGCSGEKTASETEQHVSIAQEQAEKYDTRSDSTTTYDSKTSTARIDSSSKIRNGEADSGISMASAAEYPQVVFAPQGQYLLQVGAYRLRANADRVAEDLGQMGYPAQVIPAQGVFRVRIGFFQRRSEAEKLGVRLKHDLGLDYWVAKR